MACRRVILAAELTTVLTFTSAPHLSPRTTLTRSDLISF